MAGWSRAKELSARRRNGGSPQWLPVRKIAFATYTRSIIEDLLDHEEGRDTFYYTPRTNGAGHMGHRHRLPPLGNRRRSKTSTRTILAQWFPGIDTETSGGGVGGHGHVIIDYGEWWAEDIKPIWKNLCAALDQKCRSQGIDIEKIEAKGLPSVVVVEKGKSAPIAKWVL